MAYNTKPIVTDVDGNPISQYYNPETDSYEPVVGSGGGNAVVLYNKDGTENNSLSLIPILDKLSQLTGTVIDEETRKSNELQRIEFYNQLQQMLANGELKGEKGDKGDTGIGLNFLWQGTSLGVKLETDIEYIFVDLRGPQGPPGGIDNLTSQHIEDALGYIPANETDLENLAGEGRTVETVKQNYDNISTLQQEVDNIKNGMSGLQGNDMAARLEIMDIKLKLDEMQVVDYLNKTGIGFFDLFNDDSNIDTTNTTATINTTETDVIFAGSKILKMKPETFDSFNSLELAIYDRERETLKVDAAVSNNNKIQVTILPGSVNAGDRFYYKGETYTVMGVSE